MNETQRPDGADERDANRQREAARQYDANRTSELARQLEEAREREAARQHEAAVAPGRKVVREREAAEQAKREQRAFALRWGAIGIGTFVLFILLLWGGCYFSFRDFPS